MTDRKPTCHLEVVNPDDLLVVGINDRWFRTFTSSSDRYPIRLEIPSEFLVDRWNVITGTYTNVPLVGKNDANVEYRVLLDGQEVVHVTYRSEVEAQAFSACFKDSFALDARSIDRGVVGRRASRRFSDLMAWGSESTQAPPPAEAPPRT
ncbi:MAG: hypothetical protein D6731_20575, partial [Planctomycetota bacterium]